jgi:hypothetical protein
MDVDMALEFMFLNTTIYENISLKKDLISERISSTLQCVV